MEITRPTFMEVNLNDFEYNVKQIQNKVGIGVKLMPVIKASGYGTYINQRLDVLNMFDIVAVACVDEGVYLRSIGYEKEIFVLNQPYESEIEKIIKNKIIVGVSSYSFAITSIPGDKIAAPTAVDKSTAIMATSIVNTVFFIFCIINQ